MRNKKTMFSMALGKIITQKLNSLNTKEDVEKGIEIFEKAIAYYRLQFEKIENPLDRAYSAQSSVDQQINRMKLSSSFSKIKCRSGCANCCYQPVMINEEEGQLLIEWCKENNVQIDWDKIKEQSEIEEKGYNSKCVFLGSKNECKVYERRPIACRKYFVFSDPASCDISKKNQIVEVLSDNTTELIASGFMDIDHSKVGILPKMLLQANNRLGIKE